MRKRRFAILAVFILLLGIIEAGIQYYRFVNRTIYTESTAHLAEIYHQANQSLHSLVARNWSTMRMWVPYLDSSPDEGKIEEYIENAKKDNGFTDFYFISRSGDYLTIDGQKGYLDLQEYLPELILKGQDVVVNSVVSGKPEVMVFAVPAVAGSYKGFDYEAIAISFNNSDLVNTLEISAFEGKSGSYVVHSDGRMIVEKPGEEIQKIYNFIGMLQECSNLDEEHIKAMQSDFKQGISGVTVFRMGGKSYYLVYESAGVEDWMVLGMVPINVVNSSMNKLQISSLLLVTMVAVCLVMILTMFVVRRYHQSLNKKDNELLYREELFSILSSNVDDIFAMLDAKSMHVDYISPNIEKLLGISADELRKNLRVVDRVAGDGEKDMILDQLPNIEPGEQSEWDREYIHLKTGETRWFHAIAMCRKIQGEKKYVLVLSDRTKEKKHNIELADAVNAAISANKAKSTFLSNMSHDIRTPMNAIIGFTTLALTNIDNMAKVKDYLSKILSSGNHLLSLINDVLDMSRIESGKLHLGEQNANLSDIFHDIRTIINGQIHAKQLELYMDIVDVVDEDVICDKTRLNQVLLNLLSNAIKFTPPGGTVSVRMSQLRNSSGDKGLYEICVKDTGIGMSPEFAERIFEPFERERTSTVSRIQGTGLGMAISKNIIDMMGGTIDIETEQGRGTEFTIRLELKKQSVHRKMEKIRELEGLRALVADDDFNACDSVTKMLTKVGMRSEWTMYGKEAVLRARQSLEMNDAFQVYIIDWRLPDMNGIEVARQIRRLGDDTPIIILTAYDWENIESEAKAAGVTAFCAKPMFMSDLRKTLMTALGQKVSDREQSLSDIHQESKFYGRHILLAEDNEQNREIVVELLGFYGFKIDTAENGAAALKKVENAGEGTYDLILMDVQMPVMDGYEATRRIRSLDKPALSSIPIFAMTANAFEEDRKAAEECGMNAFISKPIKMDELIQAIKKVLNET